MRLFDRISTIWHTPERLKGMETLIMATAADYAARLDTVSTELSNELADLRTQIATAVASGQAADQAWADALDAPITRLEALGKDDTDPEPTDPTSEPTA